MKTKTGSEVITLNFNHYMSSCSDRNLNQIDTFLRNTATLLRIDAAAWKIITDLQILKKANQYHKNTMRCIQLMDAEFNMTNKHVGCRTSAHVERPTQSTQINMVATSTRSQQSSDKQYLTPEKTCRCNRYEQR